MRARILVAIAAGVLLAGCGSSSGGAEEAAEPIVIEVSIADGTITPTNERVEVGVGQEVVAQVTSDAEDELHVHGEPEATWAVEAGMESEEFSYTPQIPGQIAIESHGLHATIVTLVVTP
ncbi:hypothetical protein D9V41_13200 [Aeromicrobium phragmitis]|uniref:EfeO-type cupredoxin-like domain-containing protein n=1 Tax=Aeromicrobium phragmitis TaxID=2478914 RepID=A0A3L8PI90_9ACTN|nr:hypothetical protein [Aeromicrobium phragmitis]RLV55047.1 hypothetical protein D9V41_13200 [Aeromicrobium phragmitis]